MSPLVFPIWAFAAGCVIAAQALINAKLAQYVGGPVWAAFASFLVGGIFLFFFAWIFKGRLPEIQFEHIEWWMLLGGLMGAFFVITSIAVVPQLGVVAMIALFIAGQLIAASILDHYGILMPFARPITYQKLAGIGLLVFGTYLMLSKSRF